MFRTTILLIPFLFFCTACRQPAVLKSPPGYDLAKPEELKMPRELNEISGIAFNNGNPDTLYAQQDEEGKLFHFAVKHIEVKSTKFGKKGDYEDLAISNGLVIILRSDGRLFVFPLSLSNTEVIDSVQEFDNIIPKGEYEAMYADDATNEITIICKTCSDDKATKSVTGYVLQIDTTGKITLKNTFEIDTPQIAAVMEEKKISFRCSALAKNKLTNEWYMLSSINKVLVVTDAQFKIKDAYKLSPVMYPQPEGIAFDRDNNLYISNERGEASAGTVLKFVYNKSK